MKILLAALALAIAMPALARQPEAVAYDFPLISVVDGDTVKFQADFLPAPLKPVLSVRIYGVDTPEKGHRAQCPEEDAKGKAASKFTTAQIQAAQRTQVVIMSWDKYGGRVLGDILMDGQSLRALLIKNGYAREYYGEAKQSWCR